MILKIGVDVLYALFSSTAISVAEEICIKQTLFSFFDANMRCRHPGLKRTDMYSVVSVLPDQIFFGIQTVHILSLLQLIVGLLTSSFTGYRSAFNLPQLCFGRKHVCFFTFTVSSL